MGAFDLVSILFLLKGSRKNHVPYFLLGSCFVFLASLSKGFQGLFPIVLPIIYSVIYKHTTFKSLLIQFILTISIPIIAYTIFYFTPEINQSIGLYLERRIGGTFNHLQDTKKKPFVFIFQIITGVVSSCISCHDSMGGL